MTQFFLDITFDNVNQKVGEIVVRGKQDKLFNTVQAFATMDRVSMFRFNNKTATAEDIMNIPDTAYLPSDGDEKDFHTRSLTFIT